MILQNLLISLKEQHKQVIFLIVHLGTEKYMAPELNDIDVNGLAVYDQRVDIYSLGKMMDFTWKTFVNENMCEELEKLIKQMRVYDSDNSFKNRIFIE